ncbi:MAG TPA: ATP-binding protein [Steroidobacteraceae bacterium]|nr:ATP-binding protein [Steroidobacteraceae bacterium]
MMDAWLVAAGLAAVMLSVVAAVSAVRQVQRRRYERSVLDAEQGERVQAASLLQVAEHDTNRRQRELTHLARVSMVGELSGAIAHELNQPLTAILSNAQAAQRMLNAADVNPREVYDILTDIVSEDKRAVLVIERLRALLTNEQTDAQAVDLADLTHEVLALADSTLVAAKVTVAVRLAPVVPCVLADRVQIQQVLLNLILNASEAMVAMGEGAQRQLSLATALANDGAVLVTVSDTGPGIRSDAFENLFDAFYTSKANGLGLGLSISKTIVEAHGGRIWAVNNPGPGATLCFTLPRAVVASTQGANVVRGLAALFLLTLAGVASAQARWDFLRHAPAGAFTEEDVSLLEQALDAALASPQAAPQRWSNPKSKNSGELRVVRTFTSAQGRSCKRVRIDNEARGKRATSHHVLCRSADGRWLIDPGAQPAREPAPHADVASSQLVVASRTPSTEPVPARGEYP